MLINRESDKVDGLKAKAKKPSAFHKTCFEEENREKEVWAVRIP